MSVVTSQPIPSGQENPSRGAAAAPSRRYHALDFWRAFACILVVISHSTMYAQTDRITGFWQLLIELSVRFWMGVPLFFVISGYCITAAAQARRGEEQPLREYFRRRFRRIYPPFWIATAVVALYIIVAEAIRPGILHDQVHGFQFPQDLHLDQWLGQLTLTETWRPLLGGNPKGWVLGVAWSLCYEEQFYLVTGLALLLRARRFYPALFGLAAVVAALVMVGPGLGIHVAGTLFDGRWLQFAAGVAVYYYLHEANLRGKRLVVLALLGALVWAVLARHHPPLVDKEPLERIIGLAFALVLIGLHRFDRDLRKLRWGRPVAALGAITYSLYLIHWPLVKVISHLAWDAGMRAPSFTILVVVPVCLAVAVAAGSVFFFAVEKHWLNSPAKVEA